MMTDTYIFAVNQHRLASYPHDHTYENFQYAISMSKNNAQIILVRKDNLLHYCYVRNIGNRSFWGLCLRIGCIYKDVETLFEAFDDTFVGLAEKGVILKLDDEGEVRFVTSNFVGSILFPAPIAQIIGTLFSLHFSIKDNLPTTVSIASTT